MEQIRILGYQSIDIYTRLVVETVLSFLENDQEKTENSCICEVGGG